MPLLTGNGGKWYAIISTRFIGEESAVSSAAVPRGRRNAD
jgi:hypothetical protein